VELQQNLEKVRKQGLEVAAISYDSQAVLKDFALRQKITYPLLSDPESKVIRAYGLLNQSVSPNTPQFGIPHPGTFVLDTNGVVTSKHFEEDYRQRSTASDILVREFGSKAGGPVQTVETKHLKLSSSASETVLRWGERIALVLEIDLKRGMHVYSPGVTGYVPIEWKVLTTPGFKTYPTAFPKPETLYLKAIKETVPVYKGRLRLVQEISVGTDAQVKPLLDSDANLTIEGTLRYQACDDRICYLPQTIPLKWKFAYVGVDRQRVPADLQRKAPNR
jgi:hypothetical protein